MRIWATSAVVVVAAVAGLYVAAHGGAKKGTSSYPYAVGRPGPGQRAPDFDLASTTGGDWSLAAQRAGPSYSSSLLFFQEGVDCEPWWTQIKDMEVDWGSFQALGINEMVSITTDPLYALKQKVADKGITTDGKLFSYGRLSERKLRRHLQRSGCRELWAAPSRPG